VPPMTSVAGFPQQIGLKGTEMLMRRLAAGNAEIPEQLSLIEPVLKIRSSTATWRPRS
jgi:LacI family transcriptional regulator